MSGDTFGEQPPFGDVVASVVISARNASSTLLATLDALARQDVGRPFEVIVVDNGSSDETAQIVRDHPSGPRLLVGEGKGVGLARNLGAAEARGSVIAFTDADCEPSPQWLREGLAAMDAADIVQGLVSPPPGVPVAPFDRTLWVSHEYGLYETANLLVRREWFEKIGGFTDWVEVGDEEARFPVPTRPFGEDAWFAWRARRAGARTTFATEAAVYHAVFPGSLRTYVSEQARLRHFPALVSRIPELRKTFLWRRFFLNRRTAALDLAAVAVACAWFAPFSLVALVPYVVLVRREVARWGSGRGVRHAIALVARDVVGAIALVRGSLEARTVVL